MNTEIVCDPRYPSSRTAQRVNDVLMVASFALWAMLIGAAPVVTYHLLLS